MKVLYLILLIIAGVCFALAAVTSWRPVAADTPATKINFLALGLLAWVLVPLIQQADRVND